NAFLYYALSYNTNDLAGSPYLNFFVAGLLEFPSYAFVFWGIKRWGRRPTLVSCMAVGAAATAALVFVPPGEDCSHASNRILSHFLIF
ncbi:hypothetical protein AVEN_270353-1, partial [Araneus ventricosus]